MKLGTKLLLAPLATAAIALSGGALQAWLADRGADAAARDFATGAQQLRDVAEAAGVTSITVSRFLREPAVVAAPTAERIRAALAETRRALGPHPQEGGA